MSLQLNNVQLGKLTHPLDEIRLRALEQVEARFTRSLQLNEIIAFKPVQMVKQLIRWFGMQPLLETERVLTLLLLLMRSAYASAIYRKISTTRLRTELDKVRRIVANNSAANTIIDELQDLFQEQRQRELESPETNERPTSSRNAISTNDENAVATNVEQIRFTSSDSDFAVVGSSDTEVEAMTHLEEDYELPWSRPKVGDVSTMKLVADMLSNNFICAADLDNAIVHLQITMLDYPAEYLLQTPHLFLKLVQLHERVDGRELGGNHTLSLINRILNSYLFLLKRRIKLRRQTMSYAAVDLTSRQTTAKTQLKPVVAIKLLLKRCLEHLEPLIIEFQPTQWQNIELVHDIVKAYALLDSKIPSESIRLLATMTHRLQRYCLETEATQLSLQRVKYILLVGLLLEMIKNNICLSPSPSTEDINDILLLQPVLCDYAFKLYEPLRYLAVEQLFREHVEGFDRCNKHMRSHMDSYTLAIEQLEKSTRLPEQELLTQQAKICITFESLNSIRLVKVLFNAIVTCNALYDTQPGHLRQHAEELLVTLLVLPNNRLRLAAHKLLRTAFLNHFHSFMEFENYTPGRTNVQLIQSQIFGVPLNFELLHTIIINASEDEIPEIRQNCLDCLCLMLKLETFVCENYARLLEPLKPLMPLLICLSCQSDELLELLKQLHLPDTSCMTYLQILRGNICFLFYPKEDVRQEAIQRIVYMLKCKDPQKVFLPDMTLIRDLIVNDICVLNTPRDFLRIFSDRTPGPYTNTQCMFNLLLLLHSKDTDLVVRKTAVTQLNIMLQSWQATSEFCKKEAFILPLNVLTDTVFKNIPIEFADSVIPAVGILAKLMLHNDYFRNEMSKKEEMHILTLRVLFHFGCDLDMRQDASLLLFVLVFESYMQISEHGVEIPGLLSKLHVPVSYTVRKPVEKPSYETSTMGSLVRNYFAGNQAVADTFWRLHIAKVVFGSHEQIQLPMHSDYDISSVLILRKSELSLLEATNSSKQMKRYLKAASNATDHQSLIKVIAVLQLHLLQIRESLPEEHAVSLQQLFIKYLQLQPGNELDFQLFQEMLALCNSAVRQQLQPVVVGLSATLQADINHGFLELLKNPNTSLELYEQITTCLQLLLAAKSSFAPSTGKAKTTQLWFGTLFEMLQQKVFQLFRERDLPRVRCLLSVLRHLSMRHLARSDRELQQYCRQFMRLSYELKANTQTGAQCHRKSLRIICQLQQQVIDRGESSIRLSSSVLRFLASLCGHNDAQVRSLAWIVLANLSAGYEHSTEEVQKFLSEFEFLPGGFLACCLSTLLDHFETMLVRQFAGRVFGQLFKYQPIEQTLQLLERHQFLSTAHKALAIAELNEELPASSDLMTAGNLESCEVITCYVFICTELLQQHPAWCEHLCSHAFTHKLYELFKVPPTPINMPYRSMCAQICQMYALFSSNARDFLKRTLCRDPVFLKCFILLLDDLVSAANMLLLVQFVKLMLVLCKDDTAFTFICGQLIAIPDLLVNLGLRAFALQHVNTSFQRYTLSVFILLLIKTQHHPEYSGDLAHMELREQPSLISVLEQHAALEVNENNQSCISSANANIENNMNIINRQLGGMELCESNKSTNSLSTNGLLRSSKSSLETTTIKSSILPTSDAVTRSIAAVGHSNAIVLIYMELDQLFTHLYPLRTCKFTQPPSNAQVQVCEALGVLLKLSPRAQQAARNLNLLERVIQIVQNYLDDPSSATYIRRNGDHKVKSIIRNLSLLFQLIFSWHTSHHAIITNEVQGQKLLKIIVDIWPWLQYSSQLRLTIVNICAFITEHSFVVCKLMSLPSASQTYSILHLIVKHVNFETTTVRASSSESFPTIERGLRVMINCCACAEGRMSLVKLHVLDIFDGLLPGNAKRLFKVKTEILNAWLRFWELYSRYEQGANACHLHSLLATIQRSPPRCQTRTLCLRILRNMCFVPTNRTLLTTTMPLLETMSDIITQPMPAVIDLLANNNTRYNDEVIVIDSDSEDQPERATSQGGEGSSSNDISYVEQRLVIVSLWKLFGGGAKYKAMLRGTKLAKYLTILREQLTAIKAEQPECLHRLPYASEVLTELGQLFEAIKC